jgi:hypothetical protein
MSCEAVSNLNQCSRVGTDRDGAVSCGSKTLPWTAGMRKYRSFPDGSANAPNRTLCCRSWSIPVRRECARADCSGSKLRTRPFDPIASKTYSRLADGPLFSSEMPVQVRKGLGGWLASPSHRLVQDNKRAVR